MKFLKIWIFSFLFMIAANVFAADKNFVLRLDRSTMAEGETQSLYLDFSDIGDLARPEIELPNGLELRYRGPSSQISIINGRSRRSISHSYVLIAKKAGRYDLGPIEFDYKGDHYRSNALSLGVKTRQAAAESNRQQLSEYVFVELRTSKDKVYEHEFFELYVDLFVNKLNLKNLDYPQFEDSNFEIEEFAQPQQDLVLRNGVQFTRVSFKTRAKAKKSGAYKFGPALIQVDMLVPNKRRSRFGSSFGGFDSVFDDFFNTGSLETLYLSSEEKDIEVLSLPLDENDSFSGLVGDFEMDMKLDHNKIKAGDPINLSIIISGNGALEQIKTLDLDLDESLFKVYEPQLSQAANNRNFDFVIIPKQEGNYTITSPVIKVFDSQTAKYKELKAKDQELQVEAPVQDYTNRILSASEEKTIAKQSEIDYAEDILYIKSRVKKWYSNTELIQALLVLLFLLPLLLFALASLYYRHKQMMKADKDYIAKRKAPRVARQGLRAMEESLEAEDLAAFYDTMFRTLQSFIAYKLHIKTSMVDQTTLNKLADKSYSDEICMLVKGLFDSCDMARYAASSISKEKMEEDYKKVKSFLYS